MYKYDKDQVDKASYVFARVLDKCICEEAGLKLIQDIAPDHSGIVRNYYMYLRHHEKMVNQGKSWNLPTNWARALHKHMRPDHQEKFLVAMNNMVAMYADSVPHIKMRKWLKEVS